MRRAVLASLGSVLSVGLAIAVFLMPGRPDYWVPVVARAAEPSITAVPPWPSSMGEISRGEWRQRGGARTPGAIATSFVVPSPTSTTPFIVPPGELGIPGNVLDAYRAAAATLASSDASCHLAWQMLAGIGQVETGHANGGRVYPDGRTFELLVGIPIGRDTDDGLWDGDPYVDRAVGPMQFIPSTWRVFAADGTGDGVEDPSNVFDETVAAGQYLCIGARDLSSRADLTAALYSYNYSDSYVALVLAWIDGYMAGQVTPLPPPPPPTTPPTTPPPTTPGSPTATPTTTFPTPTSIFTPGSPTQTESPPPTESSSPTQTRYR